MANQSPLTVFNLQDLFSAPLRATIDADFDAARQFVRYIRQFGFDNSRQRSSSDWGALRMVEFGIERDRNGVPNTEVVRIPTLSMIPLPLLEVREADFRFSVRILTGEKLPRSCPALVLPGDDPADEPPGNLTWRAMLAEEPAARDETQPSVNPQLAANMRVNVSVRRGDIPAGISNLIALMNENSQIIRDLLDVTPRSVTLSAQQPRHAAALLRTRRADGAALPRGSVSVRYDPEVIRIGCSGGHWPPGQARETDDAGELQINLRLVERQAGTGSGRHSVWFESEASGFPSSQELIVNIVARTAE